MLNLVLLGLNLMPIRWTGPDADGRLLSLLRVVPEPHRPAVLLRLLALFFLLDIAFWRSGPLKGCTAFLALRGAPRQFHPI